MKSLIVFFTLSIFPFALHAQGDNEKALGAKLQLDLAAIVEKQKEIIVLDIKKNKTNIELKELSNLKKNYDTLLSNLSNHSPESLMQLQDDLLDYFRSVSWKIDYLQNSAASLKQEISRNTVPKNEEAYSQRQINLNNELLGAVAEFKLLKDLEAMLPQLLKDDLSESPGGDALQPQPKSRNKNEDKEGGH